MSKHLTKAEILASLSQALDLVEGQPEGHALRTCLLTLQVGRKLGLPESTLSELYFASLLKDSGCSNNAVRIFHIFGGDEVSNKRAVKLIDWSNTYESLKFAISHTEKGKKIGAKLRRMAANLGPPSKIMNEVTAARCNRGADIARKLGMGDAVADAIQHLDEHWDGKGAPLGMAGYDIPIHSLIIGAAQTVEIFYAAFDKQIAKEMVIARTGTWFSPAVANALLSVISDDDFWNSLRDDACGIALNQELPAVFEEALEVDIDAICEAFGMIVDAKSSFTWQHSSRVTKYATLIAIELGIPLQDITTIRRAAMVHDIGKLGISTAILEKPDRLSDEEMAVVRKHPMYSYQILARVPTFGAISEIASSHHERLDGKGYWQGLEASQINLATRIVTTADVFDALTAARPYKDPMPLEKVFSIMDRDCGTAFDPDCLIALHSIFESDSEILTAA